VRARLFRINFCTGSDWASNSTKSSGNNVTFAPVGRLLATGSSPALSCGGFSTGFSLVGVSFVSADFFAVFSPSAFFVSSSDFAFSSPLTASLDFFFAVVPLVLVEVVDFFAPLVVDDLVAASAGFVVVFFSAVVSAVFVLSDFVFVVDFFAASPVVFWPDPVAFVLLAEDFSAVEGSVVFFRICAVAGPAINTTQMNERMSFTGRVPPKARD
jgi:hypothetical protein